MKTVERGFVETCPANREMMISEKSAWQRKVSRALVALRRKELHLGHKLGFWSPPAYTWIRRCILGKPPIGNEIWPQIEKAQHRIWLISRRYRQEN